MALFLLLALALSGAFFVGMQKALGIGWRDAARPLVSDYVDRLAADIGSPPDVGRARALTQHLPITVSIRGPRVNWDSRPANGHSRAASCTTAGGARTTWWRAPPPTTTASSSA